MTEPRWNKPALDRGALDHRPFGRREGVEARREQSLERRGNTDIAVGLRPKRDELFNEERIPLGGVKDALARLLVDVSHEFGGLLGREWFEHERVGVRTRRRPGRPRVEQLGAPGAEKQYRRGSEVRDVLHEVEERRLGPVQIVEDDEERPLRCEHLEIAPSRPLGLLLRPRQRRRRPIAAAMRSATSSSPATAAIASRCAPAVIRTISASGRYVIPSP